MTSDDPGPAAGAHELPDHATVDRDPISRDTVAHLAHLARLQVTDDELDLFAGQLQQILSAVETVASIDATGVPPTSHPVPLTNVLRPDVVRPSLSHDEALAGAPASQGGRFRVPRMLDEQP